MDWFGGGELPVRLSIFCMILSAREIASAMAASSAGDGFPSSCVHLRDTKMLAAIRMKKLNLPAAKSDGPVWGANGKDRDELRLFAKALSRMNGRDRKLLFALAQQMAK